MKDRLITVALSVAASFGVMRAQPERARDLDVDRLVVRRELIVSDPGSPWESGFEAQQIPRGLYARPVGDAPGGVWVRSRLIKGEIDDPFDDFQLPTSPGSPPGGSRIKSRPQGRLRAGIAPQRGRRHGRLGGS